METKFKPKSVPDEYLTFGVYFKSPNDISTEYLISLKDGKFEGNAIVEIYTTGMPCNHFDTEGLEAGSIVAYPEHSIELIVELNLYGKYFFPKFNNNMQLYYDDEKYYDGNCKSNSITSLMEAINYAIDYGLKEAKIKPY